MRTQDGYDWPTPRHVLDEPPARARVFAPMAPYFREQLGLPEFTPKQVCAPIQEESQP